MNTCNIDLKKEAYILAQIHRRFTDDQVKELIEKYLRKEVTRKYLQYILGVNKTRFITLVKAYRDNPFQFSIQYTRKTKTRAIPEAVELNILKELAIEKKLIGDKNGPIRSYNYSYIKDRLKKAYRQEVSLPTMLLDTTFPQHPEPKDDEINHVESVLRVAQKFLNHELHRYNHRQVHSATQEVPYFRFQRALREGKSLFRKFKICPPRQSVKDIFCLRLSRTVDPYRKISINSFIMKLNNVSPGDKVDIRIYPLNNGVAELRLWCNGELVALQKAKTDDLQISAF